MSKGFSKLFFGDTSIVVDIRNFFRRLREMGCVSTDNVLQDIL